MKSAGSNYWNSWNGNKDIVKFLIKANVSLDIRNNNGFTALMIAAKEGFISITKLLLYAGAKVTLVNNMGENAYEIANNENIKNLFHLELLNNKIRKLFRH